MLIYSKTNPVTIPIDGARVRLRVKRMTDAQFQDYMATWSRLQLRDQRPVDRRVGEEALTDDQVRAKRESELSVAELTLAREREDFDRRENDEFTRAAIREYLTVEPGQIQDDGVDVTTGEQVLALFATRPDVLGALAAQVYLQNTLSPDQKKAYQSQLDSAASLAELPTRSGEKRGSTAASADAPATAPSEPATESIETT